MTLASMRKVEGDEGFALMMVVGGMLALSLVILATMTYVVNSMPLSRRGQDATAALQAAQAGIDDYLARLTTCDSYWQGPCPGGTVSPAQTGWATVPPAPGQDPAQYHYEVVSNPNDEAGLLRLRSTGRIDVAGRDAKRSIVVDLRKKSLLNFIYYTDKEASDPDVVVQRFPTRVNALNPGSNGGYNAIKYGGITPDEAQKCARYYYATSTTPARTGMSEPMYISKDSGATYTYYGANPVNCDISFGSVDVLDGPAYTQDAVLLDKPLFKGPISTRWPKVSTPAPNTSAWYRKISGTSVPQSGGYVPTFDSEDIKLPQSNAAIKDRTDPAKGGSGGCAYTGPTEIKLNAGGTMNVNSPLTASVNPGCATVGTNVPLPENGVIYVSQSTASCSGKSLGKYPLDGDVTPYTCSAGDVFIEGTLQGRLTVAAEGDIVVTNDLTYKDGTTGTDALGLIANGNVEVYHPVRCTTPPAAGFACTAWTNMLTTLNDTTVSGALLSVRHSFTVQNYDKGALMGKLTVIGGIYQYYRGAVALTGSSGYAKDYRFDKRLKSVPPPSFLDPIAAPWAPAGSAEVKNPALLPS